MEFVKQWVATLPAMPFAMPAMPSCSLPTSMDALLQNKMLLIGVGVAFLLIVATAFWFFRTSADKNVLVSAEEVKNKNYDIYLDVRTKEEVEATGDFPGSLHVPLDSLEKVSGIPKGTSILVYCNTGKRARQAAAQLSKMGFERVEYVDAPYTAFLKEQPMVETEPFVPEPEEPVEKVAESKEAETPEKIEHV